MELMTEFAQPVGNAMKCVGSADLKSQKWVDPGAISWSSLPKKQDLLELRLKFAFFHGASSLNPFGPQSPGALHLKSKICWSFIMNLPFFLEPQA
jgi:hypothetical protein